MACGVTRKALTCPWRQGLAVERSGVDRSLHAHTRRLSLRAPSIEIKNPQAFGATEAARRPRSAAAASRRMASHSASAPHHHRPHHPCARPTRHYLSSAERTSLPPAAQPVPSLRRLPNPHLRKKQTLSKKHTHISLPRLQRIFYAVQQKATKAVGRTGVVAPRLQLLHALFEMPRAFIGFVELRCHEAHRLLELRCPRRRQLSSDRHGQAKGLGSAPLLCRFYPCFRLAAFLLSVSETSERQTKNRLSP